MTPEERKYLIDKFKILVNMMDPNRGYLTTHSPIAWNANDFMNVIMWLERGDFSHNYCRMMERANYIYKTIRMEQNT